MFKERVGCLCMMLLLVVLPVLAIGGCSVLGDWLSGECTFKCERAKEVK